MRDSFGRRIDYMRISVTDRCNLRCVYCMPPEGIACVPHDEILRYEEIYRVVQAGVALGITKYRITGGEPLVRKGIADFIRMMKNTQGVRHVALTSNGVLFAGMGEALCAAGLDAVNFSLDCLDAGSFHRLTGADVWDRVMLSIDTALRLGIRTKVNCVPMEDYNAGHWAGIAALARDNPLDVRFIEMMPLGLGKGFEPVSSEAVKARLSAEFGEPVPSLKTHGNGPAEYYDYPGFTGSVGFISAMSGVFCGGCNRIRLTADGLLKACLCDGDGTDIKKLLRTGASKEALTAAVTDTIRSKPLRHHFCDGAVSEQRKMVQIGG